MAQTASEVDFHTDGSNVFSAGVVDNAYWDDYLAARPKYSQEFFDIIYAYHDSHNDTGASYNLAHDVGTGPGQIVGAVSLRFKHVVGSDANPAHLAVAANRLTDLCSTGRVDLVESLGEQIMEKFPDHHGRVDMIFSGESLALMDTSRALEGFAALLRPGGTLALWYYGRPIFVDAPPECQEIYNRLSTELFRSTVNDGTPGSRAMWKRSTEIMSTWLDNIPFPTTEWRKVQRHKWNPSHEMAFLDEAAFDRPLERTSAVTSQEQIIEREDLTFWEERWGFSDAKRFATANVPSFRNDAHRGQIELLWQQLCRAFGDRGRTYRIGWPVVLILATRM